MSKKYTNIKLLTAAKKVIAEQDRMIGELTRQVKALEEANVDLRDWFTRAKGSLGYPWQASFDDVWKQAKEALIWMRAQAKEIDLSVTDEWGTSDLARVISSKVIIKKRRK